MACDMPHARGKDWREPKPVSSMQHIDRRLSLTLPESGAPQTISKPKQSIATAPPKVSRSGRQLGRHSRLRICHEDGFRRSGRMLFWENGRGTGGAKTKRFITTL
jgi:hypothetical protein